MKQFFSILLALFLFSTTGASSFAENDTATRIPDVLEGQCNNLLGCEHNLNPGVKNTYIYEEFIPHFIKTLLNWGAGIAVLMLVFAGVMYLAAGAISEDLRNKALKLIAFTIVGLLVMILARAIVSIVENLPLG
jgi:hypothetical protein